MPFLAGALALAKGLGGVIKNRIGSGKGIIGGIIKNRIKPDGFLSKVAPNLFGGGSQAQSPSPKTREQATYDQGYRTDQGGGEQDPPPTKPNWGLIGGIGAGVLTLIGALIAVFKRKKR